jgi:hypothetical protein
MFFYVNAPFFGFLVKQTTIGYFPVQGCPFVNAAYFSIFQSAQA